jgi:peptidyl-prolyl cis-trans isomerase SurA
MKMLYRVLLAGVVCSCPLTLRAQAINGIKAVVHDSVVTFHQVDVQTAPAADVLLREYRTEPEVYRKKIAEALDTSLEQLIDRQLILHEFETAGYNLPDSVIDEIVDERIRTQFGGRAALTKTLAAQGITYEKFREQARERFIVEQMRIKNVSSEIMVSPHKMEVYYNDHKAEYHVEDQVKLRMIVLNKPAGGDSAQEKELAEEVLAKIKAGAAFTNMASLYSQGSQRGQGGDWGWVERSVLRKELADVAFSLKPGDLSDVIDTPGAFYIMQVEETKPAHYKPLSEMRDEIERILLDQERTRLEDQWISRLKKKTFVRYF